MTGIMRTRPHLGTLIFPPVALICLSNLRGSWFGGSGMFLSLGLIVVAFAFLAVSSWQFLRQNPTVGVMFSACLALTFPLTRDLGSGTVEDMVEAVFGAASLVGQVGVIYFGIRGAGKVVFKRRRQARGFPVIPSATVASDRREP